MRTRPTTALPLAALAAMTAGGCSLYPSPELEVVGVAVGQRTDEAVVLNFTVEGRNKGDEALPLRTADYSLQLAGRRVFAATRSAEATIPAGGSIRFTLPAPARAAEVELMNGETVEYRVGGTVRYIPPGALGEALFDVGVRRGRASFAEAGTLRLELGPAEGERPQDAIENGVSETSTGD